MEGGIIIGVTVWSGGVIGFCRWMFMCLVVSDKLLGREMELIYIGPPTAEALLQGIFQLQRKIRRTKTTRMWYRK